MENLCLGEENRCAKQISEQGKEVHEEVRGGGRTGVGTAAAASPGGVVGGLAGRSGTDGGGNRVEDHAPDFGGRSGSSGN